MVECVEAGMRTHSSTSFLFFLLSRGCTLLYMHVDVRNSDDDVIPTFLRPRQKHWRVQL